jgi:16S rRNA (cytidine1402-2'-O)-methyltransferase
MPESATATVFLVATPIGNLEDISLRALRVLREADLIAAEDTRHTAKLLSHYDIRTPTTALHEHNEAGKVPDLIRRLLLGARIAVVTDAGTPSVSDPGYRLVRAAVEAGIRVEAVPGPSAVMAALVSSGLPTDSFVFAGFPPPRARARIAWLEALRAERRTLVFFEAPHRISATMADALATLGDRYVAIGRELTKLHEELVRGPISSVLAHLEQPRGEYTIVVAGAGFLESTEPVEVSDKEILTDFGCLTESGMTRREALSALASRYRISSRDVFAAVDRARDS